jgi:hypothetical protein
MCGVARSCDRYSTLFPNGTVGACDYTCDPVTQVRAIDNAPMCGSTNAGTPEIGCYKSGMTPGVCARVLVNALALKQDATALNWPGPIYRNGCAAGYIGMLYQSSSGGQSSGPVICTAYCRPTATWSGNGAGEGGLPGSGYTCADRGAANHECHYVWTWESTPTAADNGIGICFTPANYLWDADNNPNTPDTPEPACNTVSHSDDDGDGTPDYIQFGCGPYP